MCGVVAFGMGDPATELSDGCARVGLSAQNPCNDEPQRADLKDQPRLLQRREPSIGGEGLGGEMRH